MGDTKALLVGVCEYTFNPSVCPLPFCSNDVAAVYQATVNEIHTLFIREVKTPLQSELPGVGHSGVFLVSLAFSMLSCLTWCKVPWTRKRKTHKIRPQNVKSEETEPCSPAYPFSFCLEFA